MKRLYQGRKQRTSLLFIQLPIGVQVLPGESLPIGQTQTTQDGAQIMMRPSSKNVGSFS